MPVLLLLFSVASSRFGINGAHNAATFELDTRAFPDLKDSTITATPSSSILHSDLQIFRLRLR